LVGRPRGGMFGDVGQPQLAGVQGETELTTALPPSWPAKLISTKPGTVSFQSAQVSFRGGPLNGVSGLLWDLPRTIASPDPQVSRRPVGIPCAVHMNRYAVMTVSNCFSAFRQWLRRHQSSSTPLRLVVAPVFNCQLPDNRFAFAHRQPCGGAHRGTVTATGRGTPLRAHSPMILQQPLGAHYPLLQRSYLHSQAESAKIY